MVVMAQTIEAALYSALKNHAGLAAIVAARIFPQQLPANTALPAITYQLISSPPEVSINDVPVAAQKRFQVTVFGSTYESMVAASAEAVLALRTVASTAAVIIHARTVDNQVDLFDPEVHVHYRAIDVLLLHTGAEL